MSAKDLKFTFTAPDGKSYSIPTFKDLPTGVLRKARKAANEMDQAFGIIESVMGEDSKELAAVDSMTIDQFGEFVKAWTQGAPLGES